MENQGIMLGWAHKAASKSRRQAGFMRTYGLLMGKNKKASSIAPGLDGCGSCGKGRCEVQGSPDGRVGFWNGRRGRRLCSAVER